MGVPHHPTGSYCRASGIVLVLVEADECEGAGAVEGKVTAAVEGGL